MTAQGLLEESRDVDRAWAEWIRVRQRPGDTSWIQVISPTELFRAGRGYFKAAGEWALKVDSFLKAGGMMSNHQKQQIVAYLKTTKTRLVVFQEDYNRVTGGGVGQYLFGGSLLNEKTLIEFLGELIKKLIGTAGTLLDMLPWLLGGGVFLAIFLKFRK